MKNHLSALVKQELAAAGFEWAGLCPAVNATGMHHLTQWLANGYDGEMHYLKRRLPAYSHPMHVLPATKSLVVVALPHLAGPRTTNQTPQETKPLLADGPELGASKSSVPTGRVARYAQGADYHDVLHDRLRRVCKQLQAAAPHAHFRAIVDTAPLLEREFANLAGLGWVGKNTMLIRPALGSYFLLGAILTDQELEYDSPQLHDYCGTCTACLDACPTQAFVAPHVLDARRCISYLTIELRGPIPADLREPIGPWLFGCDVCQEVCPWNRFAPEHGDPDLAANSDMAALPLAELFYLDESAFRLRFKHTPLWRPRRRGLLRNAAIVLGNQRAVHAETALVHGLSDIEPLVRGASAWALGRLDTNSARQALFERQQTEQDAYVLSEIAAALP